jgi:hypothetical protein
MAFPGELYRLDKCQVGFGIRVEGVVPVDGFFFCSLAIISLIFLFFRAARNM